MIQLVLLLEQVMDMSVFYIMVIFKQKLMLLKDENDHQQRKNKNKRLFFLTIEGELYMQITEMLIATKNMSLPHTSCCLE